MRKNRTASNLFYNMLYQLMILILPLITAPYVSRVIGASGVGTYSYYHSIALYFVYFAMLGLANYGNRSIARVRDDRAVLNRSFSSIYLLQLTTSVIVICAYILFAVFLTKTNKLIAFILVLHVMSAFFDVSWLFFGLEEFKITSIRQMLVRIITLVVIFTFVKGKDDLWIYALIMSLGYFLSAFTLWIIAWRKVSWTRVEIKDVLQHVKPCLILFIPIIATSVYRQMDKIMVGSFSGMLEVGYYENAEKMISITLGVINAFSAVFMPKISNLIGRGKHEEAKKLFSHSLEFAMCFGVAIAFGLSSVAKEFVPLFFGDEFVASIRLLQFLVISVPFITWACMVRTLYLIPNEKDSIYIKSIIIGATVNVIINLIMIPKLNAMGAVIGTLFAESSVAIYQTVRSRGYVPFMKYLSKTFVFCVFGIIMSFVVRGISGHFQSVIVGLLAEIIGGALVYCCLAAGYFIYTKNAFVMEFIAKFRK